MTHQANVSKSEPASKSNELDKLKFPGDVLPLHKKGCQKTEPHLNEPHPFSGEKNPLFYPGGFKQLSTHVGSMKMISSLYISNDRGYSFERNCVLRRWESETLK